MSEPIEPTVDDRLMAAIRAIIRTELTQLTYAGRYEYVILSVSGTGADATVDVSPNDPTIPLPSLTAVPLLPYLGLTCTPLAGTLCTVEFLDQDPSRPRCTSLDATPSLVSIAGGTDFVALQALVASQLSGIATALNTHVHAGVQTGGGISGTAAPLYTPGSVSASKTRAT